jgi:hypothetical protein
VIKGLALDVTGHSVTLNGNDTTRYCSVSATGKLTLIHLTLAHGFGDTRLRSAGQRRRAHDYERDLD